MLKEKRKAVDLANGIVNYNKRVRDNLHSRWDRAFVVLKSDDIRQVFATKRGAENYIEKKKNTLYYDDMTQKQYSPGAGMEIQKVEKDDLLELDDKQLYYNQLWHDYKNNMPINYKKYEYWIDEYNLDQKTVKMIGDQLGEMENGSFEHITELEENKIELN